MEPAADVANRLLATDVAPRHAPRAQKLACTAVHVEIVQILKRFALGLVPPRELRFTLHLQHTRNTSLRDTTSLNDI